MLFGGRPADTGSYLLPREYGCYRPTAIYVPLDQIMANFTVVTREVFAPVQVVTEWQSKELSLVIQILNKLEHHLTAGVIDRDSTLVEYILARTQNGTTYAGIQGRTTGAPQWHWFGPAGHPASAGIGTPEAIRSVWSCHREVIRDHGEYIAR